MSYRPITDVWILARPKVKYYGAYPNGFLERARALLGVTPFDAVLHVCGGRARDYPAKPRGFGPNDQTLDLDGALQPDYLQAATDPLPLHRVNGQSDRVEWKALIADPPYTEMDAESTHPGEARSRAPTRFFVICWMWFVRAGAWGCCTTCCRNLRARVCGSSHVSE